MKLLQKASRKQVLGVMVDGRDLKIAHMGWQGGEIVIYGLESIVLPHRLGRITPQKAPQLAAAEKEPGDVFGLEDAPPPQESSFGEMETEGEDLTGTLINVFSKYPLRKARIAVNIPEGQATYYSFENDFDLKGKKLEKRLREEISPLAGGTLDTAHLDHIRTEAGGLIVVVSEGNIPIIEELLDAKNFLTGGTPYFCSVEPNEIALVNLVRANLDPPAQQITAVVYIGSEFSRVVIMKGCDPISFIQTIREGYQSPQVCQTLFSKILLEQEEAGIPEIDQIVLGGEIGVTHAHEFFSKQFPEAKVQSITPGALNTQYLKAEEIAIFPNFAIPAALAWESLDGKNPQFIRTDLMHQSIKDAQKFFKIAWHGFGLLGVIFICMVFLSHQALMRKSEIRSLNESIRQKKENIEALQPDIVLINRLRQQITEYKTNLEFLDAVIIDPGKWSRLIEKLARDFQKVNNIWIETIQSTPQGFVMIGKSATRDRVSKLAAGFVGADLKRVTRVIAESGEVAYEFEINASIPPPPEPEPVKPPVSSSDRVDAPTGSISTDPSSSNKASKPKSSASEKTAGGWNEKYSRAISLVRAEKTGEALAAFQQLNQEYPHDPDAAAVHYWIGECYYGLKSYDKARESFQTSLGYDRNTKREAGLVMLGLTYLKLGDGNSAKRQFEALLREFPQGQYASLAQNKLKRLSG